VLARLWSPALVREPLISADASTLSALFSLGAFAIYAALAFLKNRDISD